MLFHISSLPSSYSVGSLGKSAISFVDFLHRCGVCLWQVLPLTPLSFGNSPYQSPCSNAFNHYFIDLEILYKQELLTLSELKSAKRPSKNKIDYEFLFKTRLPILKKAFCRYLAQEDYIVFIAQKSYYDYALFMTLKEQNNGAPWYAWQDEYRFANSLALDAFAKKHQKEIEFWQWLQFIFLKQWKELKNYANAKGILIIGDMPMYLAYDSLEVWQNPQMFLLDQDKNPLVVAGVPPDYFSKKGQLWGNPLYDWEYMKNTGYSFWKNRISQALYVYDFVRIDHFRAFSAYYCIPFKSCDATKGEWRRGYGKDFFKDERDKNILAEDLGTYDEELKELMEYTRFPCMRVLQFAFDGAKDNAHNVENVSKNCVLYTGTHDNDTLKNFIKSLPKDLKKTYAQEVRQRCLNYGIRFFPSNNGLARAVIQLAFASNAAFAVIPMQDFLLKGKKARMNTPGTLSEKNWRYKESARSFSPALAKRIKTLCLKYGR